MQIMHNKDNRNENRKRFKDAFFLGLYRQLRLQYPETQWIPTHHTTHCMGPQAWRVSIPMALKTGDIISPTIITEKKRFQHFGKIYLYFL